MDPNDHKKNWRAKGEKGFTLVELMVVVAIIGILASLGLPQLFRYVRSAEATEAVNMSGSIARNLLSYQQSRGLTAAGASTVLNLSFASPSGAPQAPAGATGNNLDVLIPQLQLPGDHEFNYTIATTVGTSGAGSGVLVFCILATKLTATTNTVLYSSHASAQATWNRHYSNTAYVTEAEEAHAAGGYCDAAGAVVAAFGT